MAEKIMLMTIFILFLLFMRVVMNLAAGCLLILFQEKNGIMDAYIFAMFKSVVVPVNLIEREYTTSEGDRRIHISGWLMLTVIKNY